MQSSRHLNEVKTLFHKVRNVRPLSHLKLLVWFEEGSCKAYDVSPLLERFEPFKALEQDELFNTVYVVGGGYGIAWNDDLDLSCNELYERGVSIDPIESEKQLILEQVASARRELSISQTQLEKIAGVRQPVIARLERGETSPQLNTMLKLLAPLGKTLRVVDLSIEYDSESSS